MTRAEEVFAKVKAERKKAAELENIRRAQPATVGDIEDAVKTIRASIVVDNHITVSGMDVADMIRSLFVDEYAIARYRSGNPI